MQCAYPILSNHASTADTSVARSANPKTQRLYGSVGRRRAAWGKEQEEKSSAFFLDELRQIVTGLGTSWMKKGGVYGTAAIKDITHEPSEDFVLPSNVMLLTYCLTPQETRAASERLYREIKTKESLLLAQASPTNARMSGIAPAHPMPQLESLSTEKLDAICVVSGGIPSLIRLLLWQSLATLNHLLTRRNEAAAPNLPSYMSSANTVKGSKSSTSGRSTTPLKSPSSASNLTALAAPPTAVNPYSGLPSLYSIGWELQQPSAQALTEDDRLFLYALSPLLFAHLQNDSSGGSSKRASSPTPGTRAATSRAYPLCFDGTLAWHLSKAVFVHAVSASGQHNSVQTFTSGRKVDAVLEEAYRRWLQCWHKLLCLGLIQMSTASLPLPSALPTASAPYSTVANTVVHFGDSAVPQFLAVKASIHCTLPVEVTNAVSDDALMKTYLNYVATKFSETSQTLLLIEKLLVSPEAGYASSLLQQKQLLLLRSVDAVWVPHINFLATLIAVQLTPVRPVDRNTYKLAPLRAKSLNLDTTSEDEGSSRDRAPSMSSENSDPMDFMRRSNSSKLGEGVDQQFSRSLDDDDRNSEFSDTAKDKNRNILDSNRRLRAHSEFSSDDGESGKEGVVPPFERAGSSDTSFSLVSSADATEMLSSWQGHLRELSLLRLAPDLCTTLAVQSSKILNEAYKSSSDESNVRTLQYIEALYDLGLLLYTQYAEYNHESQLGAGWSRGSLHYSSVESAVSRHLAASSSKLLQEALQLVTKTLPANKSNAKDKIPTPLVLTTKQTLSFLTLQSKLEYALGNLSLTIASEAQRMYCVTRTTTRKVDEILAVKLFNKSHAAQKHGVDLLTIQLPATLAQLRALYTNSSSDSSSLAGGTVNEMYRRFLSELENYSLNRFGTSPRPVHSPTRGIGIGSMDYVDVSSTAGGTSSITLPDSLRNLVDRVYSERLEADASVLVAEYFTNQIVNRKIGDVNAMFVQCMVPKDRSATTDTTNADATTTKPSTVVIKSNIRKVGGPTATTTTTATTTATATSAPAVSDLPRPPLPRGISAGDLHTTSIPTTSTSPSSETTLSDPSKPASVPVSPHNNMYPLLLHTGTQDLRYMLLDGEYLVHQASFVEKLTEELETAATTTVTVSANTNPSAVNNGTSLVFNEQLTAEEEAALSNTSPVATLPETRYSNAHLVHSYRTSLQHYRSALALYNTLFGANSITTARVSILLGNLYRIFGHDELAKPLYEASLKVFKNHALATYQLPTVMAAHCWLGLASYFDEHQPGLPSLYEQLNSAKKNNHDGTNGKSSQKGKNDLALRLYEESLSIYKSIYGNTHYTVTLTSQALVGVLCGLGRFERGNVLLKESIAVTRLTLQKDRIMQRYLRRQLRLTRRKANSASSTAKPTTTANNTASNSAIMKLELAVESNEFALQSSMSYLAKLLVILGRFYDLHKQHHLAVAVYKEAIICMRELRVSIVRRYRELEQLQDKKVITDVVDPDQEEQEEEEEDHHLLVNLGINQPERELSLHIAQTMRDLAQSLFAEGVKLMGNKKIQNLSLPDFQYRHALYVINRAIEIYQGFDLSISAPLLKDTFTQRAAMHAAQSDFQEAKHCYEQIMRLFMEVKFPHYQDIAVVRTEYARLLVSCNEPGEAALLYEQSIDVYRRKLGDNWVCIEVAENLLERGAALLDLKAYEEAQPCLEDALKMLPMVLNKHNSRPTTTTNGGGIVSGRDNAMYDVRMAACYSHLAAVFHYYEEYGQAMSHYKSAQQVYTNAGKAFSLEMANVCNNLATLYDDLGQLTEAKEMYEQTVVILFRFHGAAHPQILVTLENLMNLLQDMKLNEEYQSVLDHLDSMEKQITTQLAEDADRLEALNRALYGQALADQERTALLQMSNSSSNSQKRLSTFSADSITSEGQNGSDQNSPSVVGNARHPFAPQQIMIVGGVDEGSDEDEADTQFAADTYHQNNNHHFQPADHYSDNVLLSMQVQEQAQYEDQADSFFSFTNISTRLASTVGSVGQNLSALGAGKTNVNAEEEWGRINKGLDGAMDEEDGFKYGNVAHSPKNADALNLNYLGDFNNNMELQAMRRDLNAKLNAPSSPGKTSQNTSAVVGGSNRGANHSAAVNKGRATIADTYKRGSSNGSKMRALRPLNEVRQAAEETEEELPAGNCSIM